MNYIEEVLGMKLPHYFARAMAGLVIIRCLRLLIFTKHFRLVIVPMCHGSSSTKAARDFMFPFTKTVTLNLFTF